MSRTIPALTLIPLLLAACASPMAPEPEGPGGGAAIIDAEGGILSARDERGARLEIEFPAGAVHGPTSFSLEAVQPVPGDSARFEIRPAGLLHEPVVIRLEMPDTWQPGARPGVYFGEASSPTNLSSTYDAASNTFTLTTQYLGYRSSGSVVGKDIDDDVTGGGADNEDDDEESDWLNVGEIDCTVTLSNLNAQITQAQLYSVSVQTADQLIKQYKLVQAECESDLGAAFDAEVQFLHQTACSLYDDAIVDAEVFLPAPDATELADRVCRVLATQGLKEIVDTECGDDFEAAIEALFQGYADTIQDEVSAPGYISGSGPWDALWGQLSDVLQVLAAAKTLELPQAQQLLTEELLPALMNAFRAAAFEPCRGEFHTQQYLADLRIAGTLMNHPIGTGTSLPTWAPFTQEELEEDLQWCGSQLEISIYDAAVQLQETLQLDGGIAPGESDHEVEITVPADGFIDLAGPIRALFCLDPTGGNAFFSNDQLLVLADDLILGTLSATSGTFLSSPFDLSMEQTLGNLGFTNPESGSFTLKVVRTGDLCQQLYGSPTFELFTIQVDTEGCGGQKECTAGAVIATTQAQVDALAGLTRCEYLYLGPEVDPEDKTGGVAKASDISDLSPLASLEVVEGVLGIIDNPLLTSLSGLDALRQVGGIQIGQNHALTNLAGLGSLAELGAWGISLHGNAGLTSLDGLSFPSDTEVVQLGVEDCPALTDLSALANLPAIEGIYLENVGIGDLSGLASLTSLGSLHLANCPDLTTLSGTQLTALRQLWLHGNPQLASLAPLSGVTWTQSPPLAPPLASIRGQPLLTSLQGLEGLSKAQHVSISGNHGLTNLQSLAGLTEVERLEIDSNHGLTSLDGLQSLQKAIYLSIQDCPNLTDAAALSNLQETREARFGTLPTLGNLPPLQNVALETFQLVDCGSIVSLGFSNCSVSGTFVVNLNESLVSIDGLEATTALSSLFVGQNPSLTTIDLPNLQTIQSYLDIASNASLEQCWAEEFAAGIDVGGNTRVWGNKPCEE